jgi:hypothetical protein
VFGGFCFYSISRVGLHSEREIHKTVFGKKMSEESYSNQKILVAVYELQLDGKITNLEEAVSEAGKLNDQE